VVERDIGRKLFWGLSPLERMLVIYAKMDHIDMAMAADSSCCSPDTGNVQKLGELGSRCQLRTLAEGWLKDLAESRPERAIVDRTSNLRQKVGASSRPSYLLRLVHSPIY
jgi:hypothetical protein